MLPGWLGRRRPRPRRNRSRSSSIRRGYTDRGAFAAGVFTGAAIRYRPVPELRPFRALRFDPQAVGDLGRVVTPPYDVISPEMQVALAHRDPRNVVRLDLPADQPGDAPEAKYRRAAQTFLSWRSDGSLRKDREASLYVYEIDYTVPGTELRRVQRGFFARLRLEPYGEGSGVLPHERTLSAPREDRYRLLRATGANFSPIVLLFRDSPGAAAARVLATAAEGDALADVTDDDGVRHRLWQLPATTIEPGSAAATLLAAATADPLTIADGHHRYETALRYQDERHRDRAGSEEAPFDFVLALLFGTDEPLTVLATHRVVRGGPSGAELLSAARDLFEVESLASAQALLAAFPPGVRPATADPLARRFGFWCDGTAAILHVRREAFERLVDPTASETLRWLDVNLLAIALERLVDLDREATTSGGRLLYTKDPGEAAALVDAGRGDAAFLVDPTSIDDIVAIATAGEVMPQKSTYFYPKPLTGLVLNPHEW
jgi:uncharacterized protein (DUF1015 family)